MGNTVDELSDREIAALRELRAERRHVIEPDDFSDDLMLLVIAVVVIVVVLGIVVHYFFWGH